ncbi:MAG: RidA family protein [Proteobacteria bacterium]|nr:RidA family protein [Pseudomonadota bacterium]
MSNRAIISTDAAPAAIGPYSQAIKVGNTIWISGQIPLDPETMELVPGGIEAEATRVFQNLAAIAKAAGGSLNDAVKINISITDLDNFGTVNTIMASFFEEPYPARACVQVAALPKGVGIEVEAILCI